MSYKLEDIVYETEGHWVLRVKNGFEVYRLSCTHSTRCAQIGFKGTEGLERAKSECDRREAVRLS
jgi:hypothetical protein